MSPGSIGRMIDLANESFRPQEDPSQLRVTEEIRERLLRMHPATLAEESDEGGPVAWVLLIPTTRTLLHRFVQRQMSEKELFEQSPEGVMYDALYLCSALVLPEYRRKGIASRLITDAVAAIRRDHPIAKLGYWPFSPAGKALAGAVAAGTGLPLLVRIEDEPGRVPAKPSPPPALPR
jgi:GNAT superfamily N-acetyltransferase